MKKYRQLLLFLVAVVSLSLLLVYRHEYNRLHYVLEVFNFFGQPCNFSELEAADSFINHQEWGVEPLWQENENVYFYSAFWNKNREAKVIALQMDRTEPARNCYLWFEDKRKPVIGKFKFSKIAHDVNDFQSAYFYYCTLSSLEHAPYAVSFTAKNRKSMDLKKVLLTVPKKHKQYLNVSVCVSPIEFNKAAFIEFLSYNKLIGLDNFIFYSNDIPHRLTNIITNLSTRLGIKVTFFAWNYPKIEGILTRVIVENDCLMRMMDVSRNVITLEMNEYIVPSHLYTFSEMVNTHDLKHTAERLSLPVQTFCITNTNRRKPIVLQNTEVSYTDDNIVRYIHRNNNNEDNVVDTQAMIKDVASIHKYVECLQKPTRVHQDNSVLKYSTDLIRSTLVQLNLHDQL